jgi:hypothetical protein
MFRVLMKVTSPVGVISGNCSGDIDTFDKAISRRDEIQEILRNCDLFTMFSDEDPNIEITLSNGIIKNSIFIFEIVEILKSS